MFSQNLTAVRNITPKPARKTNFNQNSNNQLSLTRNVLHTISFTPKHVQMKENGHRLGPCSFKSKGNFGYIQEVILQNSTQPCDFPQGTKMQLVHVAHNCILDI